MPDVLDTLLAFGLGLLVGTTLSAVVYATTGSK